MAGFALSVWWLSGVRAADDAIRASVSLPQLGSGWDRVLAPLREAFVLEHVDFLGLERLEARALARVLDMQQRPLIDVDPEAACEALVETIPRVESCNAARLPPDRLLVAVTERQPVARLREASHGLDAHGVRFELAPDEPQGLPALSGTEDAALAALLEAREHALAVTAVHAAQSDHVALDLADSKVRLLVGSDPARSLARWRRLLAARALPEHSGALEIDTRFRGQVVVRTRDPRDGSLRDRKSEGE